MANEINQRPLKESGGNTRPLEAITNPAEFVRRTEINPQAGSHNALGAAHAVSSSYSQMASLGSNLGQWSSIQLAEMAGTEAARAANGPRELIPAFTDADKAFRSAYQQEEAAIIKLQGSNVVRSNKRAALKNASTGSLDAFNKNTGEALQQLVGMSSDDQSKKALVQEFKQDLQIANTQIANKANNNNIKASKKVAREVYDDTLQGIQEKTWMGDDVSAKQSADNLRNDLSVHRDLGIISEEQYSQGIKDVAISEATGRQQRELQEARANGEEDEYLETIKSRHTQGLTPEEQAQVNQNTFEFNAQQQAQDNAYQEQVMSDAMLQAEAAPVTPGQMDQYKEELSEERYLNYQNFVLGLTDKQKKALGDSNFIFENKNRPDIILQEMTTAKINSAAKSLWDNVEAYRQSTGNDEPLSLSEKIQVTGEWPVAIPNLKSQIEQSVWSGSIEQTADTFDAYLRAKEYQQPNISGVDNATDAMSATYDSLREIVGREEAATIARVKHAPKNGKEREDRADHYKEEYKTQGWNSRSSRLSKIGSYISVPADQIPDGLSPAFENLQQFYYMSGNDWDVAGNAAAKRIEQIYGWSDINGKKEYMILPPEKMYPNKTGSTNWMRNQMVDESNLAFEQLKQSALTDSESGIGHYFEFDQDAVKQVENKLVEPMVTQKWFGDSPSTAFKVDKDGKRTSGRVIMKSDYESRYQSPPSYSIWFESENGIEPIYDPRTFNNLRFSPNPDKYNEYVPPQESLESFLTKQSILERQRDTRRTQLLEGLANEAPVL